MMLESHYRLIKIPYKVPYKCSNSPENPMEKQPNLAKTPLSCRTSSDAEAIVRSRRQ